LLRSRARVCFGGSVAAASATWLTGAAVRTFARAAIVLSEPNLAGSAIVRHRALREVPALVRLDHDTAGGERGRESEHDYRKTSHVRGTISPNAPNPAWQRRSV
jgi:hypothetical protein